jgi:hypothetical protein
MRQKKQNVKFINAPGAEVAGEKKSAVVDAVEQTEHAPFIPSLFTKIFVWWSVLQGLVEILKAVKDMLRIGVQRDTSMSFYVKDESSEAHALLAMAANYMNKERQESFALGGRGKSHKEKFKPHGNFVMEIEDFRVIVEKEEDKLGYYWVVHVPKEKVNGFFDIFDTFYVLSGEVDQGVYTWTGWSWRRTSSFSKNRAAFLPHKTYEILLADFKMFLTSKAWFEERGIPWRRGYLFYGIPGTGKTSTAICIARDSGKSLYCIRSKDCSSGETLESALNELPDGAIVLIEDLDCLFETAKSNRGEGAKGEDSDDDNDEGITLSDFLNAIDGAASHTNGRILIVTTNHVNQLDEALLRPGRIDRKIEFTYADQKQLEEISKKMLGEKEGKAYFKKAFLRCSEITMAEAENQLLQEALKDL